MKVLLFIASVSMSGMESERPPYAAADSIAASYDGASLMNRRALAIKLTENLDDEREKFRALFTWVCRNIKADAGMALEVRHRQKMIERRGMDQFQQWSRQTSPDIIRRLINERTTICSGYSWLLEEMATYAGIKCVTINGYARTLIGNKERLETINHSWNAVQLNGEWQLCDATWASGVIDPVTRTFTTRFEEGWFLTAPEVFGRSHYPADEKWNFTVPFNAEAFTAKAVSLKGYLQNHITSLYPDSLTLYRNKGDTLWMKSSGTQILNGEWHMYDGQGIHPLSGWLQQEEGTASVATVLRSTGRHLLLLRLNGEYSAALHVVVRKPKKVR